jgi:TIR domain/Pentapeptide repeats (8 copies)
VSSFWADLSGADLSGWDLNQGKPGAYSTGIDLLGVDLRDADLSGTNLAWSELTGATLSGAACREATLNSARFHGANLSGADLSGANIAGTNLQMVNFRGANLTGANLYETVFSDTDLTDVVGLDACQHSGPCTMDHRTLFGYQALPLTFLRCCGLPEPLIAELDELRQALHEDPLRFYSCFISCSNRDREFAERLHADLRYRGIRCWIYFEDLGTGEDQWGAIYTAIKGHDKLLLICSEASVDSGWVEDEVATAFAEGHKRGETVLFPIRIDDTVLETEKAWAARIRNRLHIGDFTQWRDRNAYEKALEHLLGNLRLANIP